MKRGMVVLVAGLALLGAPAAHAEPVKLTGEATVKYERDTAQNAAAVSGTLSTVKLNAELTLDPGLSLYARLAAQRATQPGLADFNTAAYTPGTKAVAMLDLFGVIYKKDGLAYKFGRQDLSVGTEALLYKRNDEKLGRHSMVDGLTVEGQVGELEVSAAAVREDNEAGSPRGSIYALRAGYSPAKTTNLGMTVGRYRQDTAGSTNHWALDGKYEFGRNCITAQYAKSSANADNVGYVMNWTYDFDGKTAAYVIGFKREAAAAMGDNSEFDGGNKGFYYGLTHKVSDAATLEVVYKDQRQISDGMRNAKFEAAMSYTF